MSYDLWLEADLGADGPVALDLLDWNYTSNVAPMWRKAMPSTDGLAGFDGEKAGLVADVLEVGIAQMEAEPDAYRELDPANGWGSFGGQLAALRELLAACRRAPDATVRVDR